jgi:hypothetical protein
VSAQVNSAAEDPKPSNNFASLTIPLSRP